ncbi:thioredoxin domain-containing protein [Candidatus Parcubacteria bacterium]|nr:thioredoxin domain-containing protein [Candidatus Parcubacteria bacterium]
MTTEQKQAGISTGTAIIIAGILIAGAIFFVMGDNGSGNVASNPGQGGSIMTNVTEDDHIYGDPKAPITIIEYSDYECPFCSRFHPTVEDIVKTNPDVKWVYRHFPLGNHRNARPAALAAECVAELGGNDMFWEFSSYLFANQTSLGDELYLNFVNEKGIDEQSYISCYESEKYAAKIDDDQLEGQLSGASGTPFSVVVSKGGQATPFSGALPIDTVQTLVNKVRGN